MSNTVDLNWLQKTFPKIDSPQQIGKGGQKSVFSGRHVNDGDVVLKIFHLNADEERVIREVETAKQLSSTRVPHIYEVGKVSSPLGDVLWVREQIISGICLADVIATTSMDSPSISKLALQMLEALSAAEAERIVHRDVKPGNIIAASDSNYWLVDFGFARHLDMKSLTATASPYGVGTPGYAPPEQFRNRKSEIDARADLFALGVTLYECAEGVNPFWDNARDISEVLRRVENQPLPPITRQIDQKGQFQDLVAAMTRIQADHRPSTAKEALEWMREICSSENI